MVSVSGAELRPTERRDDLELLTLLLPLPGAGTLDVHDSAKFIDGGDPARTWCMLSKCSTT